MKINSYQIGMDSARTYSSSQTRKLTFNISQNSMKSLYADLGNSKYDSREGTQVGKSNKTSSASHSDSNRDIDHVRQRFVLYLWQLFFGKKSADDLAKELGLSSEDTTPPSPSTNFITIEGVSEKYFSEQESLSFSSGGFVQTADGRQIDFSINVQMTSSFESYYREEGIALQSVCDPLVLNFDGDIANLSDETFLFDLDGDGEKENISTLASGNGFLALDKNNDGIINDGNELFGTSSGDGFADLSAYDEDGNGWIDENDSIFDKLKVWVKDSDGNDRLLPLKSKNVGAIFLGNASTQFGLRSAAADNHMNGYIRKTGIFMYEDGSGAGLVSHLDMAMSS